MDNILYFAAGLYLLVGLFKAGDRINSGKVGVKGPAATFLTVLLLWPFV
jgi:hypothetical protein